MQRRCEVGACEGWHYARGWCQKHYARWLRHGDPHGSPAQIRAEAGLRRCAYCKRILSRNRFSPKKTHVQSWCKDCCNARAKRQYAVDPSAVRDRSRRKHEQYRDRELARMRRRRREKSARLERLREARERGAAGTHTVEQLAARAAYFGNRCAYCRGPFEVVDHVKPLVALGSQFPANLRPACSKCNRSKHAQWPLDARWRCPPAPYGTESRLPLP